MADRKLKITEAFCKTVKDDGIHTDPELRGFCLRVRGNSKVFIARAKLRGTRQTVLVTIGPYPRFGAEEARRIARGHLFKLSEGINPNQERKDEIAALEAEEAVLEQETKVEEITLRKVFEDYLQSRKLKENTEYIYKCTLRSTLSDWLDLPLLDIKKDMVERRHRSISQKGHKGHADHSMRILRALFTYAMITYEDHLRRSQQRTAHKDKSCETTFAGSYLE